MAVYIHRLSNHASVMEYVALFNTITSGLIFVRPNRYDDGSLQGTMIIQYKLWEQADAILAAIVPTATLRIQGKLVLSDRSCFI